MADAYYDDLENEFDEEFDDEFELDFETEDDIEFEAPYEKEFEPYAFDEPTVFESALDIFDIEDSEPTELYIDAAREIVREDLRDLPDEDILDLLDAAVVDMSPEEIEGFLSGLKNIGRSIGGIVRNVAPTAMPILGGALGTFVGGPAGTAIGSQFGRVAGQLVAGRRGTAQPRSRARPRAPVRGRVSPIPAGGSSAAAQLMSLISNPALLQSLLSTIMGRSGRESIRVGPDQTVAEIGAFTNAIERLAAETAREVHEAQAFRNAQPEYLSDSMGQALVDTADPDARAMALLTHLAGYREDEG